MKFANHACSVLLVCALASGCSASSSPSGSGTKTNATLGVTSTSSPVTAAKLVACDLLTRSDVLAAVGGTVSTANTHDPNITDGPNCEYAVTGSKALGTTAHVFVELTNDLSPAVVRNGAKHPLGTEVTVKGVGDAASYDPSYDGIDFVKANHTFLVQCTPSVGTHTSRAAQTKAAIIAMARDVANRA